MRCFLKIHNPGPNMVVGACDEECLGKILDDGRYHFDVNEDFYKDQLITLEEACEICKKSPNFNIVGENLVNELIKAGIIKPTGTVKICGVPVALRFVF